MSTIVSINIQMPKNKDDIPLVHALRGFGVPVTETQETINFLRKKTKAFGCVIVISHPTKQIIPGISQFPLHFVAGVEYHEIEFDFTTTKNEVVTGWNQRGINVVEVAMGDTTSVSFHQFEDGNNLETELKETEQRIESLQTELEIAIKKAETIKKKLSKSANNSKNRVTINMS